ncbi:MAG TPA: hypothetical protein VIL20_16425 [Sandaracinaceae bacterium]
MAKQDDAGGSGLAGALGPPLRAGSLENALHEARAFFMRHPGDEDAKRVVEALELLMAQVWFAGAEDGEAPDPRFVEAASRLGRADLEGALASYEAIGGAHAARARLLAQRVRLVRAAARGAALPPPERAALAIPEVAIAAFDEAASAYPSEPTRHLEVGEYELIDEAPSGPVEVDDERTRIFQPKPPPDDGTREVTRIAAAGELPLEELRRQMQQEADDQLDELIGEAAPPAAPAEPSLVLDITVDFEAKSSMPERRDAMTPAAPTMPRAAREEHGRISRSEVLPFAATASATTPQARPHRPSSPGQPRESGPPPNVPSPPPAPPPAPESMRATRPDLLSAPSNAAPSEVAFPSGAAASPPAPEPLRAALSTPPSGTARDETPSGAPAPHPSPPSSAPEPIFAGGPARVGGPAVPPPPAMRGPAVPPPPVLGGAALPDPVHAPIDPSEVAPPARSAWTIHEPGADAEPEEPVLGDASWAGVRAFAVEPAAFEPSVAPVDADSWEDEATLASEPTPEQRAELLAARGELAEALRIYQEEAVARPDEPHLWDRVAELARMLQERGR